jgi:type IV secretory pathway TraG/TraD family ATPase VirD4
MEKLWSAANIAIYGGGVDDARFLDRLSKLIGTHERLAQTRTTGEGGRRSTARAVAERTILTPAELRELPPGRAVLFASGTPAALLEPLPWWRGPHAAAIRTALATGQGRVPAQREPDSTPDARKALR